MTTTLVRGGWKRVVSRSMGLVFLVATGIFACARPGDCGADAARRLVDGDAQPLPRACEEG